MPPDKPFACWKVRRESGGVRGGVESITVDQLPPGDVLIRVAYSSLNYKDALACQGHPGVVKQLPHVPGIDCAGEVAANSLPDFRPGDPVLVTGYDLGASRWGGLSEYVRVPAEWVVPLPDGLTLKQAMTYGTAGFTAAQCVDALIRHGIQPGQGEIAVTGATGGVGSIAIALLAKLGFAAVAFTGKQDQADWLAELGAQRVMPRDEIGESSDRPLLSARWAGAVDTVGGTPLSILLRSTAHRGCVAACGQVAGDELNITVYPFILRGVTLAGIDSAKCPRESRWAIWRKLASEWRIDSLHRLVHEISLDQVGDEVAAMLAGRSRGRAVVRMSPKG